VPAGGNNRVAVVLRRQLAPASVAVGTAVGLAESTTRFRPRRILAERAGVTPGLRAPGRPLGRVVKEPDCRRLHAHQEPALRSGGSLAAPYWPEPSAYRTARFEMSRARCEPANRTATLALFPR